MSETGFKLVDSVQIKSGDVKYPADVVSSKPILFDKHTVTPHDKRTAASLNDLIVSLFQTNAALPTMGLQNNLRIAVSGETTKVLNFTRQDITVISSGGFRYSVRKTDPNLLCYQEEFGLYNGQPNMTDEMIVISKFIKCIGIDPRSNVIVAKLYRVVGNTEQEVRDSIDRIPVLGSVGLYNSNPDIQRGQTLECTPVLYSDVVLVYAIDGNLFANSKDVFELNSATHLSTRSVIESGAYYLDNRVGILDLSFKDESELLEELNMTEYCYIVASDGIEPAYRYYRDMTGSAVEIPVIYRPDDKKRKSGIYVQRYKRTGLRERPYVTAIKTLPVKVVNEEAGFYKTKAEALAACPLDERRKNEERNNQLIEVTAKELVKGFDLMVSRLSRALDQIVDNGKQVSELNEQHRAQVEKLKKEKEAEVEKERTRTDEAYKKLEEAQRKIEEAFRKIEDERRKTEDERRRTDEEKRNAQRERKKYEDLKASKGHYVEYLKNGVAVLGAVISLVSAVKVFMPSKKPK